MASGGAGGAGAEPRLPRTAEEKENSERLIIVLERAGLETVKTRKVCEPLRHWQSMPALAVTLIRVRDRCLQGFELLNSDDHKGIHKKLKRDPARSRPDIVHQVSATSTAATAPSCGHAIEIIARDSYY